MKKYLISFLLLLVSFGLFSQSTMKWEQAIGGPGIEIGYSVKSCVDQGYIVAGSTASNGISDGYLVRTDSLGIVMWSNYFIGDNVDVYRSVKQLPDSGFIIAGFSNSSGTNGGYDGFIERTNKNGDSLWSKFIGTADWDFFYDVALTYDHGFVFAGGTYGLGSGDEDFFLVKTDSIGNVLWTKTFGGLKQDEARGIIETGDSLIATVGFTFSLGDSLGDSWIIRLNQNGDSIWTRTINQPTVEDKGWGIADMNIYGRIMIVGESSAVNGDPDGYIEALTYSGNYVYNVNLGGAGSVDNFTSIITRPNGTMACVGTTENNSGNGHGDFWFFHDRNGFSSSIFGTLYQETGYGIDLAHDDGYITCGFTQGYNLNLPNLYLVKLDTTGVTTGILGIREQPRDFTFGSSSIFPNPATNALSINYDSNQPINGNLQMIIFDISGRKIMEVSSDNWEMHSIRNASCQIDISNLNIGLYTYFISDELGGKSSGKFIVNH